MKRILFFTAVIVHQFCLAQDSPIRLGDCIDSALTNRASLKIKNAELITASLEQAIVAGGYLPEITIAYDYRYNPVIQSQILPVGLFKPMPDDEKRAVKIGTAWNQNAGLSISQPLIDAALKSRITEAGISQRLKKLETQISGEELRFEVVRSFARIFSLTYNTNGYAADTVRTFYSYQLIRDKFNEGKLLKTELNKALLNHNKAVSEWISSRSEWTMEIIYLGYITGIPASLLLDTDFDFGPLEQLQDQGETIGINVKGVTRFREFDLKKDLLQQQIRSEKRKNRPGLDMIGFLGANQFTDSFQPYQANSWFGNSYVGLSLKIPLLQGENTGLRIRQLNNETKQVELKREELKEQLDNDLMQIREELMTLQQKIRYAEENINMMVENTDILKERFANGQLAATELNIQEADLQKERSLLFAFKARLIEKQLELLIVSGNMEGFLTTLN